MAHDRRHVIARLEMRDPGGHGTHRPGKLETGRERQLGLVLVLSLHQQYVGEVDAGGLHIDDDLARGGLQVGPVLDLEVIDPGERAAEE